MVNLLGRRTRLPSVEGVDPGFRSVLGRRLDLLAALARSGLADCVARAGEALAAELEELESSPSRVAAEAFLARIDAIRHDALACAGSADARALADPRVDRDAGPAGRREGLFVGHRPGRSLATGEAEIASRGLFDVRDRPPLDGWIGVLPVADASAPGADFWIVAFFAREQADRARAGCRACPTDALILLDEVAGELAASLAASATDAQSVRIG